METLSQVREIILQQRALVEKKKALLGTKYDTRTDDELLAMYDFLHPPREETPPPEITPLLISSPSMVPRLAPPEEEEDVPKKKRAKAYSEEVYHGRFIYNPQDVTPEVRDMVVEKLSILKKDIITQFRERDIPFDGIVWETMMEYCRKVTISITKWTQSRRGFSATHLDTVPCWCRGAWCNSLWIVRGTKHLAIKLTEIYMRYHPDVVHTDEEE